MSKRRWITIIATFGFLLCLGGTASHAPRVGAAASTPPNIVLILADDQRFDQTSLMPHLNAEIAAKGVTFSNSFVVNPLCCPARATILTGETSGFTDIWTNSDPHGGFVTFRDDGEEANTIATWFHDAGYATSLDGKYLNEYLLGDVAHVPPGWDDWHALVLGAGGVDGEGKGGYYDYTTSDNGVATSHGFAETDYSTTVLGGDAVNFINSTPSDKPLFLYFAPRAPHQPATPELKYKTACKGIIAPRNPNWGEADVSDKPAYIQALPLPSQHKTAFNDNLARKMCQSLLSLDDQIDNIISALQATGRLHNTLIMYASDNGLLLLEHRFHGKLVPYEESIKVPMFVRYDPVTSGEQGTTDTHLVQNLDYASTFADAAGIPHPGAMGDNLIRLMQGNDTGWRDTLLLEHWSGPKSHAGVPAYCGVRNAQYTYAQYATGEQELYDVIADPYELNNQANNPQYATTVSNLHAQAMSLCNPRPPGWPATIN